MILRRDLFPPQQRIMKTGKREGGVIFNMRYLEKFLMAVAILVSLGLTLTSLNLERNVGKKKEMMYQLQMIRMGVALYKSIEKKNPDNLEALATTRYAFPGDGQSKLYLEVQYGDNIDFFVDPFGNKYGYNKETGWVNSTTKGCEYW